MINHATEMRQQCRDGTYKYAIALNDAHYLSDNHTIVIAARRKKPRKRLSMTSGFFRFLLKERDVKFNLADGHDLKTLKEIEKHVMFKYDVSKNNLRSRRRFHTYVKARYEAFYLAYMNTQKSFPEIGRYFGKDHTTIMHGAYKHADKNGLKPPGRATLKK